MAVHLLDGLFLGLTNVEDIVGQREKLVALGSLSAGLAHELNNPAAAEVAGGAKRSASGCRTPAGPWSGFAAADGRADPRRDRRPPGLGRRAGAGRAPAVRPGRRRPRRRARPAPRGRRAWPGRGSWPRPWSRPAWTRPGSIGSSPLAGDHLRAGLGWLAASLEIDNLVEEISSAPAASRPGRRHEGLQPARPGRAMEEIDVHDGLESTLVILHHRLKGGMEVVRDYDRTLPKVSGLRRRAQPGLDQHHRQRHRRHGRQGNADHPHRPSTATGCWSRSPTTVPGSRPSSSAGSSNPSVTTKDVGKGTGLGLDISYRIVVRRHHGDLSVTSSPGDTRFQVRLPLRQPAGDGKTHGKK